jgi:hypothetical protein
MFMNKQYDFTNLNGKEEILSEITRLESRLSQEVGNDVILIAYSKDNKS